MTDSLEIELNNPPPPPTSAPTGASPRRRAMAEALEVTLHNRQQAAKARKSAYMAARYAANPEAMKIKKHKRRARLLAGGALSRDIVERLKALQRGMCAGCGCNLSKSGQHIDHIVPLAKGGANTDDNVQLLCPPCNLAKNAKHPIDWAQENGRLL